MVNDMLNQILSWLYYIPIAFVAAMVLMWLGFQIKARLVPPDLPAGQLSPKQPLKENLPPVVRAYLTENFGDPAVTPATAVLWGRGKFAIRRYPVIGLLWAPLRWTLIIRPGYEFIWRINLSWYRFSFLIGGDELIKGQARFLMGKEERKSENLNLSQTTMLWLYSLLAAPSAVAADDRLEWQILEDRRVRMRTPFPGERTWDFNLAFDSSSGDLVHIETSRTTSRTGLAEPFQVRFSNYLQFAENIALPGKMQAAWGDEFYIKLDVEGVQYDADIESEMERGV